MSEHRPFDSPYRNQLVRIADLTVNEDVIHDLRFENCQIVGPAMFVLQDNVTISGCTFTAPLETLVLVVSEDRMVTGVVGLKNVEFYGCTFIRVGFILPPDLAKSFAGAESE